jgi:hypothetical protein
MNSNATFSRTEKKRIRFFRTSGQLEMFLSFMQMQKTDPFFMFV